MKYRGIIDETLAAMFSNEDYRGDYLFYAHLIGQCSIKLSDTLPAPAGVRFIHDHYELVINHKGVEVQYDKIKNLLKEFDPKRHRVVDGVEFYKVIKGFEDFKLVERLAILKHEMLHILYNHIGLNGRIQNRKPFDWNVAADCALNQHIHSLHIPKEAILPKKLEVELGVHVPQNKTAEFYYELLQQNNKEESNNKEGLNDLFNGDVMDTHETWGESVGDEDLKKSLTEKMISKSRDETLKSAGRMPDSISEWLELHSTKSEINWKKVLKRIVGNKKVGSRPTIMRKNRRFPEREDLRGTTKNRVFNVLIVADVSGSMSSKAILKTLTEIKHICEITHSSLDLIQIDTHAYNPEKIDKNTRVFKRKAHGGTILFPAIEKAKEHRIDYQAVVILTDGGVFDKDIKQFGELKKKVVWLIEPDGNISPLMSAGRMKAFKLSK